MAEFKNAMYNRFEIETLSSLIMFQTLIHVNHGEQFNKIDLTK